MTTSTKSKRSTASDTAIKKTKQWLRVPSHRGDIDQIFDLYWGGKERRITGMTVRIIGVNFVALVGLLLGVVYLGQYHSTLIASKLERFETEIVLVTAAITEGAFVGNNGYNLDDPKDKILRNNVQILAARLGATLNNTRILVFDDQSQMIADSTQLIEQNSVKPIFQVMKGEGVTLYSIEMLKNTAGWIASFFPRYSRLQLFSGVVSDTADGYPDARDAQRGKLSMSAWRDIEGQIVLTAAMPIIHNGKLSGVVFLVNNDEDIKKALGDTWFNILKIFLVTLLITILLSIYLSGVIARPLRKLASAAENVRKGNLKYTEIPDMSGRHDEIGELSIVLRDMTHALWERMDAIENFAADVSHEIKNPLTSLKSAVETASIVTKKADREKLLNVIKHDVQRLDRLITDISKASRLDSELSREIFDLVDLKSVLRHLVDMYKSPLDREAGHVSNVDEAVIDGVRIILDLPDDHKILIRGSESRLIQVFHNILENAVSFSPKGSAIRIIVYVEDHRVDILIEDEGAGIPEGQLESIFDRFYSERPQHEEYGRHSGLGLSICKQIITAHNGIIYAENKTDDKGRVTGARFVVILNVV